MVKVSPLAFERLEKMLRGRGDDVAIRIVFRQGRARLRASRRRADDQIVMHGNRTVLVLDDNVARQLNQRTIDVRQTVDGPRLRLQHAESQP